MDIQKFIRKPFPVEAVQVTEENMEEVAAWCGGEIRPAQKKANAYIKVNIYHATNKRQTQAFVGDWVIKMGKGFKVYLEHAMPKTFVPDTGQTDVIRLEIDPVNN